MKMKADEGSFRARTIDRLPELLKIIAEEREKIPPMVLIP